MAALPDGLGAASARRYLRDNLPAIYADSGNGRETVVMSMLGGLELVLDPLVVLLDNLVHHLDPATAPVEMVDFLIELAGAPADQTLPLAARRRLARDASRIAERRGTKAGLELALNDALPGLMPQVLDRGVATSGRDAPSRATGAANARPPAIDGGATSSPEQAPPAFEVLLAREPIGLERGQLVDCVADHLPAGARYVYRVLRGEHA